MPSGQQYRFVTAVWGTSQEPPTLAAKWLARMPTPMASYVRQKLGSRLDLTPQALPPLSEPAFHVWFRSTKSSTSPRFGAVLADHNGAGYELGQHSITRAGRASWLCWSFHVVPRRSATLTLYALDGFGRSSIPSAEIGRVSFSNPLFGHYPQWQPEPLPVVKKAGDLEVRLVAVVAERQYCNIQLRTSNSEPGAAISSLPEARFNLMLNSTRGTNEGWVFARTEVSDATGNLRRFVEHNDPRLVWPWAPPPSNSPKSSFACCFGCASWPDEQAWRLKLDFKRSCGHDPQELVTFKNVPVPAVGATNILFLTNGIHGVPIVLKQEFCRETNRPPVSRSGFSLSPVLPTRITLQLPGKPADVALDFVRATQDQEWNIQGCSWSPDSAILLLDSIPTNVATVDIAWAVQKLRSAEFLVKPPIIRAASIASGRAERKSP